MRNIVITGGTSGLGKAIANNFIQQGDNVIVLSRNVDEKQGIKCDVENRESIINAFAEIKKKIDKIDILINNAGVAVFGATELVTEEEINKVFDVIFFGTLYCTQQALSLMHKGGKVINISSACALFALPYRALYCSSKSAVNMLSLCLSMELKSAGIQVTSICPGNIKTNFSKNRIKNFATNEKYGKNIELACQRVDKEENNRMPLPYATAKICKIINKKKMKAQYIIGGKYKMLYFLSKLVPLSWILGATSKVAKK